MPTGRQKETVKMVYQLIYVSTATGGTGERQIADILETARHNNKKSGITGLLLCHGGTFFQALEGEQRAVTDCFAAIKQDSRHKDVVALLQKEQQDRTFSQWSMGYAAPENLSDHNRDIVVSLSSLASELAKGRLEKRQDASILADSFVRGFREFDSI